MRQVKSNILMSYRWTYICIFIIKYSNALRIFRCCTHTYVNKKLFCPRHFNNMFFHFILNRLSVNLICITKKILKIKIKMFDDCYFLSLIGAVSIIIYSFRFIFKMVSEVSQINHSSLQVFNNCFS